MDSAKRTGNKKPEANPGELCFHTQSTRIPINSCSFALSPRVVAGDIEHSKADSISWHAMRLAVTRLCISQMEEFLRVAGVEPNGNIIFSKILQNQQYLDDNLFE